MLFISNEWGLNLRIQTGFEVSVQTENIRLQQGEAMESQNKFFMRKLFILRLN